MKLGIYAIRDIKNDFGTPFNAVNDDVAKRIFLAAQNDKESMMHQFPADFELWKLAEYWTTTGEIVPGMQNIGIVGAENG